MILRLLLLAAGLVALAASLAIGRPEHFVVIWPCAVFVVVVAAGAIAADAVPLRRAALACSVATLACGVALLGRWETQIPLAAAIVALQLVALAAPWLAARRPAPGHS
jgi:hypothetical protein